MQMKKWPGTVLSVSLSAVLAVTPCAQRGELLHDF
jgi:hypothetical protein